MDNTMMMIIGGGLALVVVPLIMLSKSLDWLPFKVFRVKSSNGKKALMRKREPLSNKYYVADVEGNDLIFNESNKVFGKDLGRVTIPQDAIHTEFGGCKVIEFDKEGRLYRPDGSIVTGFDPKHFQDLLNREAEKPPEDNGAEKLRTILAIVSVLGIIVTGYLVFKNSQKLDMLIGAYDGLKGAITNMTIHTIPSA